MKPPDALETCPYGYKTAEFTKAGMLRPAVVVAKNSLLLVFTSVDASSQSIERLELTLPRGSVYDQHSRHRDQKERPPFAHLALLGLLLVSIPEHSAIPPESLYT